MLTSKFKIIIFIAIILTVIEVGLEYRAYHRGWNTPLFGFQEREVLTKTESKFGPIEGFSFRSPIIKPEKRDKTYRIWLSSSSYGEDVYIPADKIFAYLLGKKVSKYTPYEVQVLNASKAGFTIKNNILDLKENGEKWKPDVVVLYQMSNDITEFSKRFIGGINTLADSKEIPDQLLDIQYKKSIIKLFENTTLYSNVKSIITPKITKARLLSETNGKDAEKEFRARVNEFIDVASKLGSRVVLCTFSVSYDEKSFANPPGEIVNNLLRFNRYLSYKGWVETVRSYNNILREIAIEKKLGLIDISKMLTGKHKYFRDFIHFTSEGHNLVSTYMVKSGQLLTTIE